MGHPNFSDVQPHSRTSLPELVLETKTESLHKMTFREAWFKWLAFYYNKKDTRTPTCTELMYGFNPLFPRETDGYEANDTGNTTATTSEGQHLALAKKFLKPIRVRRKGFRVPKTESKAVKAKRAPPAPPNGTLQSPADETDHLIYYSLCGTSDWQHALELQNFGVQ